MRGVVIWYSACAFQAVIWCEDSKELGIAVGPTAWRNPMATVEVGDYVSFDVVMAGTERRCRDVHLIEPMAAPTLVETIERTTRSAVGKIRNPLLHLCVTHD